MKPSALEKLSSARLPEAFKRDTLNQIVSAGLLGLLEPQTIPVEIIETLRGRDLAEMARKREITMAMVKPHVHEAVISEAIPAEIAGYAAIAGFILSQINRPLEIVFDASVVMSKLELSEFYSGGPMQKQKSTPAIDPNRYGGSHTNRWDEFCALMTSGPVTYAVLYGEGVDAIALWRQQMGDNWNVEKVRDDYPASIRARLARNSHNNLLHGSDSPESVIREATWLADALNNRRKKE